MAVWRLKHRLAESSEFSDSDRFVACWAGVWLTFFSFAGTKLPNYVLPMYPALALITARYLREWQVWEGRFGTTAFRHSCRAMAVAGILMMVAAPIAMSILLPGEEWLTVVGAVPLFGASLAYVAVNRGDRSRAIRIISTTAIVLALLVVGIAPTRIGPHQDSPKLAEAARRAAGTDHVEIGVIESFTPSLVFYAEHPVQRLRKPDEVVKFIESHPHGFVVARSDRLEALKLEVPNLIEVSRHRRFLRRHDLVLLSGPERMAANATENSTR
jgi:4-amino-4-deoxy-L-arabinose transferase-like glycosyltransferase